MEDLNEYDQVCFWPVFRMIRWRNFRRTRISSTMRPPRPIWRTRQESQGVKIHLCNLVFGLRLYGRRTFDETRPVESDYPYGISKLQGEQAAINSPIRIFGHCLRKGTISGYSPRMRLDLIVNTMFRNRVQGTRNRRSTIRPFGDPS